MQQFLSKLSTKSPWFWLALGLVTVYISGLFIDVMDVDASQYASISMEMLQNGSWLQVQHRGVDYLDKPPLLFWLSTSSFSLFGLYNWAYKLPSLLAALAGVYGINRFTLIYYTPRIARHAAFLLASAIGLIVICNDVRTDTLLLGTSTCAVWQLAEYLEKNKWKYLIGGFFFIGLAMLAKGPIGLVISGFGIGTHLLLTGQWRQIFKWQWIVGLLVSAIVLAPMCWGLWQQFDLHPEKTVNDKTGVSGLYFFFWEQSFGRITGENVWRNDASAFYFIHVYLWAFLPWCLMLYLAFMEQLFKIRIKVKETWKRKEYISIGAFLLSFAALSASKYKLPHYIFITLPWAAVLLASYLNKIEETRQKMLRQWMVFYLSAGLGIIIAFLLPGFVFPTKNILIWVLMIVPLALLGWQVIKNPVPGDTDMLIQRGVFVSIFLGLVLNLFFYPRLLPYQSSRPIAEYARKNNIPADKMANFRRSSHALDFYNQDILEGFSDAEYVQKNANENGIFYIETDGVGREDLINDGVNLETLEGFNNFKVALLNTRFLNPARRSSALDTIYLLKILPSPVSAE
ncbi:MAG: glycosyltransferase family 39 protein [Saprospiraceae bacterium]|nr:glycosyltransferase family 39 protein [Saprospiraceae bacterium]